MEEIVSWGLNHTPTEDSEIAVSLILGSDLLPVARLEGLEFDSSTMVPVEVGSLPER